MVEADIPVTPAEKDEIAHLPFLELIGCCGSHKCRHFRCSPTCFSMGSKAFAEAVAMLAGTKQYGLGYEF